MLGLDGAKVAGKAAQGDEFRVDADQEVDGIIRCPQRIVLEAVDHLASPPGEEVGERSAVGSGDDEFAEDDVAGLSVRADDAAHRAGGLVGLEARHSINGWGDERVDHEAEAGVPQRGLTRHRDHRVRRFDGLFASGEHGSDAGTGEAGDHGDASDQCQQAWGQQRPGLGFVRHGPGSGRRRRKPSCGRALPAVTSP